MKQPHNDPIASPEDSKPTVERKQRAGRNIVTFFVIYALGAFSLYIFIMLYGAISSTP